MKRHKIQKYVLSGLLAFCGQLFAMPFLTCCSDMNPEAIHNVSHEHNESFGSNVSIEPDEGMHDSQHLQSAKSDFADLTNMSLMTMDQQASSAHEAPRNMTPGHAHADMNDETTCNLHCDFCGFVSTPLLEQSNHNTNTLNAQEIYFYQQSLSSLPEENLFRPPIAA